jgi:hypothetical protein
MEAESWRALELESTVCPGAGFTPDAVPIRRKKKDVSRCEPVDIGFGKRRVTR